MLAYVLQRLIESIPALFLATLLIFFGLRLLPGDPASVLAGLDATPEALQAIRQRNGLDQPIPIQYVMWLNNVVHGDLGVSFFTRVPVSELLGQRLPATLELGIAGVVLSIVLGIPSGIVAAVQSRRTPDWIISSFNGFAVAVPGFWLGILSILLFSLILGWLPPGGRGDLVRDPLLEARFLLLPALTLALPFSAGVSRLVKGSMLEVLSDDYVRTARAKGITERGVVWHHALRNALVPVTTTLGLQFGSLLGGAVITESVFSWPGIGRLMRDSIVSRDYAVVQACLLLLVVLVVLMNLLTDFAYGILDPRIRLNRGPR